MGNNGGSADHFPDGEVEAIRAELLSRLRVRSREVEAAIVAAALEIGADIAGDREAMAGLRAAARETVELLSELIERGTDWTPRLPGAVAAQARHLARGEVGLEAVMRGHYSMVTVFFEFATSEIAELPAGTLPYLIGIQSKHGDYLMGAVSAEYEAELQRVEAPGARRLEQLVERLLAGESDAGASLDYDLEGWHLGLIGAGPEVGQAIRRLSERLGARLLLVPRGADRAWAWLGSVRPIAAAELERRFDEMKPTVRLASGEPRQGIEGWRRTHAEALTATEFSPPGAAGLTRSADVLLLAATVRDAEASRILVEDYLAPLDRGGEGTKLRETLRAYYAGSCNAASTAASLGVDRQTVRRRLRRVEETLGRRLDSCRPEMEMALRVEEFLGSGAG